MALGISSFLTHVLVSMWQSAKRGIVPELPTHACEHNPMTGRKRLDFVATWGHGAWRCLSK